MTTREEAKMSLLEECMRVYAELERLLQLAPEDIVQQLGGDVHQVITEMSWLEISCLSVCQKVLPPGSKFVTKMELLSVDIHVVSAEQPDARSDADTPPAPPPVEA